MKCSEVPTLSPDVPELPTRGYHEPDAPDYRTLEFSPDDDDKLTRAAQWGKSLIQRALDGDVQALADMRAKLHVTRYEVAR